MTKGGELVELHRSRAPFWERLRHRLADALTALAERVRPQVERVEVIEPGESVPQAQEVQAVPNAQAVEPDTRTPAAAVERTTPATLAEQMSIAEVCDYLKVTRQTVRNLCKRGKLTKHAHEIAGEHGERVYFDRAEVEQLHAAPRRKRKGGGGRTSTKRRRAATNKKRRAPEVKTST